ncbi:MAG: Ni/Fe hydrogenase subunit alpha [Phycisphaeraceae bacterium]
MTRTITIDPVTRIEGHAKITLILNEDGGIADAMFHVTQFRGFEKFIEGRPLTEMPAIMARICGICPVSHLMASSKACDDLLAVQIPETGVKLRRIMNLAQFVQSHALSFFHLSSPDILLGMDSDPAKRNIFGLIQDHPERARDGIRLRAFGQKIIEILGGKRIHPAWTVPGGVNEPLTPERRDQIAEMIPEAKAIAQRTLEWFKPCIKNFEAEIEAFANFDTLFLGLVTEDGKWEHYDGKLRMTDARGKVMHESIPHREYHEYLGEAVADFTYLKFPYYKPMGYPQGIYRVGPLARVNISSGFGTPLADAELRDFRKGAGNPAQSSFHFHWARLLEILHGIEQIEVLINDPDILNDHVRAHARPNRAEGVGISEAPRGTLIHHYKIDLATGQMTWANLIIATGHNNLAMNRGIRQVAERFVDGRKLTEGMLNRVEAVIRTFDPCLSCSTHALGQMPLHIQLLGPDGATLDEIQRD